MEEVKETSMESMTDRQMNKGDGAEISDAYNNENLGMPFTGSHTNATCEAPKYKLFGEKEIGGHYGRSGSPTGKKFNV